MRAWNQVKVKDPEHERHDQAGYVRSVTGDDNDPAHQVATVVMDVDGAAVELLPAQLQILAE